MRIFLTFSMFLCLSFSLSWGQTNNGKKNVSAAGVVSSLTSKVEGQGTVSITQDPHMVMLLKKAIEKTDDKQYICYSGYRVQVYMGNHQKKSKAESYARESKLKEKFPDLSYYVAFSSPFWKLKVGDFRTYTDALALAYKLKTEFPDYAGDIIIVRDDETRDLDFEKDENPVAKN